MNGWGITRLKVPPFMMTLGVMSIAQGIALQLRPQPGGLIPREFAWLAAGEVFGIPIPPLYFLLMAALGYWILTYTRFGRYVYTVGGNEESTRLTGLPTDRIKLSVYVLASTFAALAGIFLFIAHSVRRRTDWHELRSRFHYCGGTRWHQPLWRSRQHYRHDRRRLIIASLSNIMNLVGVSTYYQYILKGGILILAVAFYSIQRRR